MVSLDHNRYDHHLGRREIQLFQIAPQYTVCLVIWLILFLEAYFGWRFFSYRHVALIPLLKVFQI